MLIAAAGSVASAQSPEAPPRLQQVVRITAIDGVLRIEWIGPLPNARGGMTLRGPEGMWNARVRTVPRQGAETVIQLSRQPAGTQHPDQFWNISIIAAANQVMINASRSGRTVRDIQLAFSQRSDGTINGQIIETNVRRTTRISAKNLVDLRLREPYIVRQFIVPLLKQITTQDLLMPGAADVYRAFPEIEPDAAIIERVERTIPRLSAPDADDRDAASEELARLGPRAVRVLLRIEESTLTPEAAARIADLLDLQSRRRAGDIAQRREDPAFLTDCLEFDDDRVRRFAKASIERILDRTVAMPLAPTPGDWSATADLLRAEFTQRAAPAQPGN